MTLKFVLPALVAAVSFGLTASNLLRAGEPAAAAPGAKAAKVTVELFVVEVSLTKLRSAGFVWEDLKGRRGLLLETDFSDGEKLKAFLQALRQYDIATILSEPTITTLDGRPASFAIDDKLKLDVVPIVLGNGRIRIEHRLELPERKLKSESAVEVEPGQAVIASQVRSETKDAAGKVREVATMVIVRADTKPTAGIGTADASAPDSTSRPSARLQAPTYQDLESRPIKR